VAGSLAVTTPDKDGSFDVRSAGHSELRLQLDLPRALPGTQATATVTAPDGTSRSLSFLAAPLGGGPVHATLDTPEAGQYTVHVHLDSGVTGSYDLAWCAPGSRADDACPA
jgi:hypothetical protein